MMVSIKKGNNRYFQPHYCWLKTAAFKTFLTSQIMFLQILAILSSSILYSWSPASKHIYYTVLNFFGQNSFRLGIFCSHEIVPSSAGQFLSMKIGVVLSYAAAQQKNTWILWTCLVSILLGPWRNRKLYGKMRARPDKAIIARKLLLKCWDALLYHFYKYL